MGRDSTYLALALLQLKHDESKRFNGTENCDMDCAVKPYLSAETDAFRIGKWEWEWPRRVLRCCVGQYKAS